jgi:hypothetical protein
MIRKEFAGKATSLTIEIAIACGHATTTWGVPKAIIFKSFFPELWEKEKLKGKE